MRRKLSPRQFCLPQLLRLEDRLAPATFTVTNTGDLDGMGELVLGSLRHRILQANGDPDPDTINFALPGPSYVINPSSALPVLINPTFINGASQPGFAGVPIVELRGNGVASSYEGLYLAAGGSTVSYMIVNNFANGTGIYMDGAGNKIQNCYVGVDSTGASALSNGWGVRMDNAVACTITDNIISGNVVGGIVVGATGAGGVSITKNFVGTDLTGTIDVGNGSEGVSVSGPNITIGGATPEVGNLISGNGRGIYAVVTSGLLIQGNRVGTDVTGAVAVPNADVGIQVENSPGAKIGGTTAAVRNLVSGNGNAGIVTSGSSGVMIQGNYVGVDGAGAAKLGNGGAGIVFNSGSSSLIGGTAAGAGNVVSGNGGDGVQLQGASTVMVQGNYIGTDAAGTAKLGNGGNGVFLLTSKNNTIGGTGGTNLIADNGGHGISIGFNAPFGSNTISANNIGSGKTGLEFFGNAKNGIEIFGSSNNLISGGNLIVCNGQSGVMLRGGTTGNTVRSNSIGLNALHGVLIVEGASKNMIGGTAAGNANLITANGTSGKGHGVLIESGTQNQVRRNSISGNASRGIDLNNDAVTPNDVGGENAGDASKANKLQDYPVLVYRQQGAADTGFHTWKLNSRPSETFTLEFFSNPSLDPTQHGEGEVFFLSDTVTTDAKGNATLGVNHSGRMQVTATATDKDGNTSEFAMVDTDADGLADSWELAGIDVNEDGVVDLNLPVLGANRMHKDIFVEVDAMVGRAPTQADLNLVASEPGNSVGFAFAPDALVHNPDQTNGIALHAKLDDVDIPLAAFGAASVSYWGSFDAIKNTTVGTDGRAGSFGSKADRGDANWANIRAARQMAYRYCLFADRFGGDAYSGIGELSNTGWGTNDFMVTIRPTAWGGATGVDRAGTFMHELGHTLNLRHGGGDNTHNKPNFHSVMNYSWQIPNSIRRTIAGKMDDTSASWRLDYSRDQLATLDEAALNEPVGIGGTAGFQVPYGQATIDINGDPHVTKLALANETGAVNWNMKNGAGENPVAPAVDINFDGIIGQKLAGHEDWSNLKFYFREADEFGTAHGVEDHNDMPLAELPPPVVESVTINDGGPQRSRVLSLTIVFDQVVTLPGTPESAFTLVHHGDALPVDLNAVVFDSELRTTVTLTFSGGLVEYGSLKDGRYTLTVIAGAVSNVWGNLDGNADGTAGDSYVLASADAPDAPTNIFRQFGDINGDGFTDNVDLISFRAANGSDTTMVNYNNAFDVNGDGFIDNVDFIAFRQRLGMTP